MSPRKKLFVWFHRGKYLMVSEWTSNPRQLIITDIIYYLLAKEMTGILSNIMEISSENFTMDMKVMITLEATWLASRHYG